MINTSKIFLIISINALQVYLRLYPKTTEATGNLISDKIADKIAKIVATKKSETVANKHDKQIPKRRYVFAEKVQKFLMI